MQIIFFKGMLRWKLEDSLSTDIMQQGSGVECKEIVAAFKDQKLSLKHCNL